MKKLAFIIIIITLLTACRSVLQQETYELKQVVIDDIKEQLKKGKYISALQDIDYLERNGTNEISELKEKAQEGLLVLFNESIENDDFFNAYKYFISIETSFDTIPLQEWSRDKVLFLLAEQEIKNGEIINGLLYYLKAFDETSLDREKVEQILDFALEVENIPAIKYILSNTEESEFSGYREKLALINIKPKATDMMKGTATVWVDRGIKIEQGFGFPDIVLGSSFFIDKRGYLITNYHVIQSEVDPEYEGYSKLFLRLPSDLNEKIPAKVIGWDRIFDLALLKVELEPEYIFHLAGNLAVEPGEKVFVIGSPLDPLLENTITSGIISSSGRRHFLQLGDVIQIDAPVNPGNSGGPLLNENYEFAGVVFAGIQPYEGLNFAIPVSRLISILPKLFQGDEIKHPWIGVGVNKTEYGIKVIYTIPGSSGQEAGIQQDDLIVAIDGEEFDSIIGFQDQILKYPVGTLLDVTWLRNGERITGKVVLEKRPYAPFEVALEKDAWVDVIYPIFGLKIKKIGRFGWTGEYIVEDVLIGSIADNSGITVNDPIIIKGMNIDDENHIVFLQMYIQKKTEGFLKSAIQIAAYLESDIFL